MIQVRGHLFGYVFTVTRMNHITAHGCLYLSQATIQVWKRGRVDYPAVQRMNNPRMSFQRIHYDKTVHNRCVVSYVTGAKPF